MKLKKLIAIGSCVAMLATVSAFAADIATPTDEDRPNDSASVVKYADFDETAYTLYEAEEATLIESARINSDHEGFKGTGCVALTKYFDIDADKNPGITFEVETKEAGETTLAFGYNNGHAYAQS